MKFCVNVTQKFVGNKLQLFHTNFCVTYMQMFLQCMPCDLGSCPLNSKRIVALVVYRPRLHKVHPNLSGILVSRQMGHIADHMHIAYINHIEFDYKNIHTYSSYWQDHNPLCMHELSTIKEPALRPLQINFLFLVHRLHLFPASF